MGALDEELENVWETRDVVKSSLELHGAVSIDAAGDAGASSEPTRVSSATAAVDATAPLPADRVDTPEIAPDSTALPQGPADGERSATAAKQAQENLDALVRNMNVYGTVDVATAGITAPAEADSQEPEEPSGLSVAAEEGAVESARDVVAAPDTEPASPAQSRAQSAFAAREYDYESGSMAEGGRESSGEDDAQDAGRGADELPTALSGVRARPDLPALDCDVREPSTREATAETDELSPVEPESDAEPEPESPYVPLSEEELRERAASLQDLLQQELGEVRTVKTSCAKLKLENKSLQEYIESLMARR